MEGIMKYWVLFTFTILFIGASNQKCDAQFFKRLKKRAEHAVERKVEQKVDETVEQAASNMVEKAWDQYIGEAVKNAQPGKGSPFTLSSNVKTEDVYHFNIVTTMKIKTVQNGTLKSSVIMKLNFNNHQKYTGARFIDNDPKSKQNGDTFIIYDFKNDALLMLMNSNNNKFSFAYDWKQAPSDSQAVMSQQPMQWDTVKVWHGFTKIGNKTIAGYDCTGYQYKSDSLQSKMWVTGQVNLGVQNLLGVYNNTKQFKGKIPDDYPSGMIMEMTSENLNNGDKTTMTVTNINKNAEVNYKMSDYPPMSLGNMRGKNK
jgi:hypothetical protein